MAPSLSLAKHRGRARERSRGAVVFIVAMTLAVLASLGLYALSAANVEIRTSGYGRQNAQTHYLSEYGSLAGAQTLNGTNAQLYLGLMTSTTLRDGSCTSLIGVPTSASNQSLACRRMGASELFNTLNTNNTNSVKLTKAVDPFDGTKAGSLGPFALDGDFYVELTDPAQASAPPGFDTRLGLCFMQFTVSSYGMTQPNITSTLAASPGMGPTLIQSRNQSFFASVGVEASRARVRAGPVRCAM